MRRDMRFPTMWYVRPAKAQTSLRICAVRSEPLLVAWISYDCQATDWTAFGVCKFERRLHRLVWVYTSQMPHSWKSDVAAQMCVESNSNESDMSNKFQFWYMEEFYVVTLSALRPLGKWKRSWFILDLIPRMRLTPDETPREMPLLHFK